MTEPNTVNHLAACLAAICDPDTASNPVAWFDLHQAGLTRTHIQTVVDNGDWIGPLPCFAQAPDPASPMWQHLLATA